MADIIIGPLDIDTNLDKDGDLEVWINGQNDYFYLNKEERQALVKLLIQLDE